jgi:3-methyl-2-oxobutanoate hydroxymethyltransferase
MAVCWRLPGWEKYACWITLKLALEKENLTNGKEIMASDTSCPLNTIPSLCARKNGQKIVCLTAYDAQIASLLDPHVDILLVGDSLGMVVYGMEDTLSVTLDMMIAHGRAVAKSTRRSCSIVDMPFGSYQECPEQAFRNAARLMAETGCDGIKLEGGAVMANTISFLVARGIPVMAHIGLLPQSVNSLGGFKAQGKSSQEFAQIIEDAKAVDKAGAFAIVIEGVYETLANEITGVVSAPTIGIGASAQCDGQILVTEDMLGLGSDEAPRFVKRYGNLGEEISSIIQTYASEVKEGLFPKAVHCYKLRRYRS